MDELDTTPPPADISEVSAMRKSVAFSLRESGATYSAIGRCLGVSVERARQIVLEHNRSRSHLESQSKRDLLTLGGVLQIRPDGHLAPADEFESLFWRYATGRISLPNDG
jgi:hypothetical protein